MTKNITPITNGKMNPVELHNLGLNVIPMNVAEKKSPIKWGEYINRKSTLSEIDWWSKDFPSTGWGIVTGPISGIFVLDIDAYKDGPVNELIRIEINGNPLPKTWSTRTQRGGFHYYFRWDEALANLPTSKYNLMAHVDIRGKGGYVVAYPWTKGYSPADVPLAPIPDWLMKLVTKQPSPNEAVLGNRPGWIAEELSNLEEGKRHAAFAKVIGRLNRAGLSPDDIYELLVYHAQNSGFGPTELRIQVDKMCKLYADQAAKPMASLSAQQLLSSANVKIPWLVQGLFPKEGVGILAGHPKIGKSWLTLSLAIAVSTGLPWLKTWSTVPGRFVYVDEESSLDMLGVRLRKLMAYQGLTDVAGQFMVKEGFSFSNPNKIDELRRIMDLTRPSLLVMDSLNRVHKANENSASEMGEVFRKVSALSKEFGCFILFTDHLPHGMDRFRGSSDKEAFVDVGLLATKVGNTNLLVEHKYARYSQVPSFELAILDDGPEKTYVRWIG